MPPDEAIQSVQAEATVCPAMSRVKGRAKVAPAYCMLPTDTPNPHSTGHWNED